MYKLESDLQKDFTEFLSSDLSSNEMLCEEFNARFGNVDVVKVTDNTNFEITLTQLELLSDFSCAMIVGYLHKKSIRTLSFLSKKTGYSLSYLKSTLSLLKKHSIIYEINANRYLINPEFEFPRLIFNAYELKLKDWKKAILQAIANQKFASFSWIVMPMEISLKLFNTQRLIFSNFNIGLIGVDEDGKKLKYFITPKKSSQKIPCYEISSTARYFKKTATI